MSGPRILILNRSYWPDAEASGQLLTELCEDLAAEFEMTVIAGQPNQNPAGVSCNPWGRDEHHGVSIRRVPHLTLGKKSLWGRAFNMLTYLAGAFVTALCVARPAAVVVETDPFLLPIIGRWLQWRHRCRLVVYLQDIYPDVAVALGKVRKGWFTSLLRRWLFSIYRQADRVIVLGDDMRSVLTDSGIAPERITVLPNWADTSRISPIRQANTFRQREQLEGYFVVMYSGNMGLCQNLDDVLEAAARLCDRRDILFILVGDGASRSGLERNARERGLENVRFLPYQPHSELAHSLSAADLHLIPLDARVTGCVVPCKLYGILAAGVPALVIADERCETSRVVAQSHTGRVVPPGSPQQLVESIVWCADHRQELSEMGARARLLAEYEYDRKTASARFAHLLHDTIGASDGVCEPGTSLNAKAPVEPKPAASSR